MFTGFVEIVFALALILLATCPAMAQVTDAGDINALQRLKNTNNCNGVLDDWRINGDSVEGPGIEADANGHLAGLDLDGQDICGVLTLRDLSELRILRISGAYLDGMLLDGLPRMQELRLSHVQPDGFAFLRQMTLLKLLQLDGTGLSELAPLANLTELEQADLSYNRIYDLGALRGLVKLSDLKLFHNLINDVKPLAALPELTRLDLETNKINDIVSLGVLRKLEVLNIADNKITDVATLQNMPRLAVLDLSDNLISDAGFLSKLPALVHLDLRRNLIRDIRELKSVWARFEFLGLEGNRIPLHQMYDEALEHRWAAGQENVYFELRVQYLPALNDWVIPQEDLKIGDTDSKVRIEGPDGGATYDAEKGRIMFEKAGNYKIVLSNTALAGANADKPLPVTKSGVITVLDVLPDELELYTGREEIISPAVVNTLYMLLQTHGVVEVLDDRDPYYDAIWMLKNEMRPPRLYWQKPPQL